MSLDLNSLQALREVRRRREERMARQRERHARQCELIERELNDQRLCSERLALALKQRRSERWTALFSDTFDSVSVMFASREDQTDDGQIQQAESKLRDLASSLAQAQTQQDKAAADHAACVRKLESWGEFVDMQCRKLARRDEILREADQEDTWGARHVV